RRPRTPAPRPGSGSTRRSRRYRRQAATRRSRPRSPAAPWPPAAGGRAPPGNATAGTATHTARSFRWRFLAGGAARLDQGLEHVHEGVQVLEAPVDRGEADVGHLVELPQPLHHEGADLPRGDLAVLSVVEHGLRLADDRLEAARRHHPLLAGLEQAGEQLLAAELLARAVVLDHHVRDVVDLLVGGEAPPTAHALAPPPDGGAVAALARIHDPVAVLGAEGTPHGGWRPGEERQWPRIICGSSADHLRHAPWRPHSLVWKAMLKPTSSFSRSAVSLISTGRSCTASTTRCCSSSTWKLNRMRRARAKSERLSVISMLRDSSARPLVAAALAPPAAAGAGGAGDAPWRPGAGGAPEERADPADAADAVWPIDGGAVEGWAGCMASRRSFSSSLSTSKERLLPLHRLALERTPPVGGVASGAAGAAGLAGCGAGASAPSGTPGAGGTCGGDAAPACGAAAPPAAGRPGAVWDGGGDEGSADGDPATVAGGAAAAAARAAADEGFAACGAGGAWPGEAAGPAAPA